MKLKNYLLGATAVGVALLLTTACTSSTTDDQSSNKITVETIHADDESLFPVNSEIIYGEHEAIIVDAQFDRSSASKLALRAKELNRTVSTIYISHSDPDYYFGAAVLQKEFPQAKIVSTPQTAQIIERNSQAKLTIWGPQLKEQAPESIIVPTPLQGDTLSVDGEQIKIIGLDGTNPDNTFLWIPSTRTILGGASLQSDSHLWLADSKPTFTRDLWISQLESMKALDPQTIIPSHFNPTSNKPATPALIDSSIEYLRAFETARVQSTNSAELIEKLIKLFPNLGAESNLEMSAKVIMGEQKWETTHSYPGTGKVVHVDFGEIGFDLNFTKDNLTFVGTTGSSLGVTDSQPYSYTLVGPQVFMVTWSETHLGSRVVHVQDFHSGTVLTNIAEENSTEFLHLQGTLHIK